MIVSYTLISFVNRPRPLDTAPGEAEGVRMTDLHLSQDVAGAPDGEPAQAGSSWTAG